jgi:hypothetical protein
MTMGPARLLNRYMGESALQQALRRCSEDVIGKAGRFGAGQAARSP